MLYSKISKSLQTNTKTLEKDISRFVDQNGEILLTMDFSQRFSFSDSDRDVLYRAIGITLQEATTAVAQTKIHKSNKIQSNPFYLMSVLAARYYLKNKDEARAKMVIMYMSLNMYTSIHKGEFKFNANKEIMDYTLSHLSADFIITKVNSVYEFIMDNTITVVDTYKSRIISGEDTDLVWVVDATWTRLKQKMIRLARYYYNNHKSGHYLNTDSESYTDTEYIEMDNDSFFVDRLTNKVYIKLINHQFDSRLLKYSITKSDTSYQKLKNLIDDIIDDPDTRVKKVISTMIEYYLMTSGKPAEFIARGDFIAYMQTSYGTNSPNEKLIFIKDTIDEWLTENMSKYGRQNFGKTARQSYRKSLYMFFVFLINLEAKVS